MTEITLALGGGGVRGAAHLGVLRVLEREGFRIRAVAGTSAGAILGAFYAAGLSAFQIEEIMANLDQSRLYGWPLSEGPALLGVRGIADLLKNHLGEPEFHALKLPFAVVAVDLNSNREIILQDGGVIEAVLGSMAVPGLFPPREIHPYRLIDGGVLDPVPVRAARALAPGLPVVAVSLMAPLDAPSTPPSIPLAVPRPILEQITRLHVTQAFQIFADALDIGQRQMTELRLQLDQPEILIRPEVNDLNLLDRINVAEVALRGERAALAVLPELRRAVSLPAQFSRHWRRLINGG